VPGDAWQTSEGVCQAFNQTVIGSIVYALQDKVKTAS
jgi:hypothetical protein